jgi:hypothetical protein
MLSAGDDDIVAMLSTEADAIVSADALSRQLAQRPAGASAGNGRLQRGHALAVMATYRLVERFAS